MFFQGGFAQDFKLARTLTWNFSVERQLGTNWLVRGAYVANETYNLINAVDRNPGFFSANGARLKYPEFTQILEMVSWATSNYQSAQFTVEKRFANGFQFQSNYTFSKALDSASIGTLAFTGSVPDPNNMRNNRGWSAFYFPHVFVNNFVWELPKLTAGNAIVRGVLGGWQLSGIWRMQSGPPFAIRPGSGNNASLLQTGGDRADYVSGQPLTVKEGEKKDWLNRYFNTNAFQPNAPGTIGNTPRYVFHAARINTWDTGVSKNWAFQERYRIQFRWEMFNTFNTPSFAAPTNSVSSSQFGRILSTGSVPPRVMQGALKFYF
jgi:hypothetical protein